MILLIQPPIEDFYLTEIRTYPMGVLYLATWLANNGVDVQVLDALKPNKKKTIALPAEFAYLKTIYNEKEIGPMKLFGAYYRFGLSNTEILEQIAQKKPDTLVITCNFTAYFNVVAILTAKIKAQFPNIRIIIGGYHATVFKKEIALRFPQIDDIIEGADESTFLSYFGISKSKNANFLTTIPQREFIDSTRYQMHRKNMSFLVTSRGCPQKCTFCTVASMYGPTFIQRSVESILIEMRYLYDQHTVRVFDFEDDNLSLNSAWFLDLLNQIHATFPLGDITIYAMNGLSAETLTKPLLQAMWNAGFRSLNLSLVAAQDNIKANLHRPSRNSHIETVVTHASHQGFFITVYFILGLPNQTKEDIDATLDYLQALNVLIAPSIFYPPPGTSLYNDLITQGQLLATEWNKCRSSVFPIETPHLSRADLVYYFRKVRLLNFKRHLLEHYGTLMPNQPNANDAIGISQLQEYEQTGKITPVFRW